MKKLLLFMSTKLPVNTKSILCVLLLFVLTYSTNAQSTDTLKVTRVSCISRIEDYLKPETFVFTPISDTLQVERSKWQNVSSKPIAIRKVINDIIYISFSDTGKAFLTMMCYETQRVKLPSVFTSKNEVIVNMGGKYFKVSNLPTSFDNDEGSEEVLFFPNPTRNQVFINKNNYSSIILRNAFGQEVLQVGASVSTIDLGVFEAGIYYLTFLSDNGGLTKMIFKY